MVAHYGRARNTPPVFGLTAEDVEGRSSFVNTTRYPDHLSI